MVNPLTLASLLVSVLTRSIWKVPENPGVVSIVVNGTMDNARSARLDGAQSSRASNVAAGIARPHRPRAQTPRMGPFKVVFMNHLAPKQA
jgi:hypothetical protein